MCVCVYLNHIAIHQQLTQHCKSTMLQLKKKINGQLLVGLSCEAFIKTQNGVYRAPRLMNKRRCWESGIS